MTQDEVDEIAIDAWNRRAGAERLREELADAPKCEACVAMLDCDECLRADGSHKERRRLSAENAKLRELAEGLMGHVKHPPCEGCIAEMNCDCSDLTQCDEWLFFEADARDLGIEVPQ